MESEYYGEQLIVYAFESLSLAFFKENVEHLIFLLKTCIKNADIQL